MIDNGFMEDKSAHTTEWWSTRPVSDLKLHAPMTVQPSLSCVQCIDILKTHGFDQLPVVSADGEILGMVWLGSACFVLLLCVFSCLAICVLWTCLLTRFVLCCALNVLCAGDYGQSDFVHHSGPCEAG
jgi:hypothetical protein